MAYIDQRPAPPPKMPYRDTVIQPGTDNCQLSEYSCINPGNLL